MISHIDLTFVQSKRILYIFVDSLFGLYFRNWNLWQPRPLWHNIKCFCLFYGSRTQTANN